MKKFILMLALFSAVVSGAKAQIATENSNALDNISFGVTAGVSTPLDFNSVFPLNTNVGIKLGKEFSPIFGIQAEGIAFLNDNHFSDIKTAVKATNLGLNGTINLSNAFVGYKGIPRNFELGLVTGLGWLHAWNTSANFLTAKTGLDFMFNLGKKKAHSLVLTPAVYWNLNKFGNIHFDKRGSQLAINLSYIYHFKTSNGTHHFKAYDVGAMFDEINRLNGALSECESRQPIIQEVEKVVEVPTTIFKDTKWFVQFAQGSAELTDEAKAVLDTIGENSVVDVIGTASPEGSNEFNQMISEKRAEVVADYLTKNGIKVNSWEGKGVHIGLATNRLAIVKLAQ